MHVAQMEHKTRLLRTWFLVRDGRLATKCKMVKEKLVQVIWIPWALTRSSSVSGSQVAMRSRVDEAFMALRKFSGEDDGVSAERGG